MGVRTTDKSDKGFGQDKVLDQKSLNFRRTSRTGGGTNPPPPEGYQIQRSLIFNSSDSSYLSRTPGSVGNRKTWTWSAWVKRSKLGDYQRLFFGGNECSIRFENDDTLRFSNYTGTFTAFFKTTAVYRDVSAWYHIVLTIDTPNATSTDRLRLYVNGERVTAFTSTTYPTQNFDLEINGGNAHYISSAAGSEYFSGYLAEIYFIDGQALTPSSFGELDSNNVWSPKEFSGGSYGTNGFYLNFSNNSGATSTTLGKDQNGSNDWTPNNISVVGNTSVDSATGGLPIYATSGTYGDVYAGPTTRTDSFNSSLLLALPFYANSNDISNSINPGSSTKSTTNNGVTFTSITKYYSNNSVYFDSTDTITISSTWFGNTNFTVEFWVRFESYGDIWTVDGNNMSFYVSSTSISLDGNGQGRVNFGGLNIPLNLWTHIAYVKSSGTYYMFINGIRYSPVATGLGQNSGTWVLGGTRSDVNNSATCYMQDLRYYSTAKYTTSFTIPSNITGINNDSTVDSPTSYGSDTGLGSEVRGNYCTWNPLDQGGSITLSNGNLSVTTPSSGIPTIRGTLAVSSGKWFYEFTVTSGASSIGFLKISDSVSNILGSTSGGYGYYSEGPGYTKKINNNVQTDYGSSFLPGDIIGVALDLDVGTIAFYKNGASQGVAFSSNISGTFAPAVSDGTNAGSISGSANFGQRPFAYTVPSGYKALCTTNLPTPTIADGSSVMDVVTYVGNSTYPRSITGLNFSPDLIWTKIRTQAYRHMLADSVRGTGRTLTSSNANAESVNDAYGSVSAFNSNGWSIQSGSISGENFNQSGESYVAWTWDFGSSTVPNNNGSIASQVRSNGYLSIVTYTGSGSNATIGHGLGIAPQFIIVKNRTSNSTNWQTGSAFHNATSPWNYYIRLNTIAAATAASTIWNNTAPTNTVFSVGTDNEVNFNANNYVAYCFAPIPGFSSFGVYSGNGISDGPFINTGFRPRWILIKRITADTSGGNWIIKDALRPNYNESNQNLFANLSNAETTEYPVDFLSNGFKIRVANTDINGSSSQSYFYAAFSESPFRNARAR